MCFWSFLSSSGVGALLFLPGLVSNEAQAQFKIKVYGRWCGPNHGFGKPPIDAVDNVCKLHDICCRKKKYGEPTEKIQHCDCDRIIVQRMRSAISRTKTRKGKRAGFVILNYFRRAPCYCKKRICVPAPSCRYKRKCTTKSKRLCSPYLSCRKQRKCTKVFGKKKCTKVRTCKRTKKCTTKRVKVCAKVKVCRTVRKCTKATVFGRGGQCHGWKKKR
ncbi:MAG: hypothetical protein EP343_17300 [Deltaproteobacteria bacterium]|nr:MAG: hypothetical protein EP343_17300 [Deltaproteobacteria bacterium]